MPAQSDFPDKWTCDGPNKTVKVEVRVPRVQPGDVALAENVGQYDWIEIPTMKVEQWVEKGDAAQIQRTAKVEFPSEWGQNDGTVRHNSPRKLIRSFESTDAQPFLHARVWFREDADSPWTLTHHGWIGGIGPSGDTGVHKFWVYDFAELLSSVAIGHTFSKPSIRDAAETLAKETNQNTPIPVGQVTIMAPNTEFEEEAAREAFENEGLSVMHPEVGRITDTEGIVDARLEDVTDEGNYGATIIDTDSRWDSGIPGLASKTFTSNHDTLLEMYKWFERKTNAKLHFEPRPNSVVLVADIQPTRRIFGAQEVEGEFFDTVHVLHNNALYEMKPMNTLRLRGSTGASALDPAIDALEGAVEDLTLGAFEPPAEQYPVIKVQVPSLVEAAEGVELSPEIIESDASTLDDAEAEAKRRLAEKLEETSEGQVVMRGSPAMLPFDGLEAFEVCNGDVQYEQEPVRYEVESVKHVKSADEVYKTRILVSIWANDENIETVKKTMVQVEGGA